MSTRTRTILTTRGRPPVTQPRWQAFRALTIVLMLLLGWGLGGRPTAAFQDATPEAQPETDTAVPGVDPSAPHAQVIAHGLAILPAAPVVWRVREITPPPPSEAEGETGGFSFTLQRAGGAVIRNDVTDKRALLEPGQAFFMSADDPYTRRAEGRESTSWVFEMVPPGASTQTSDGDVVFTSGTMDVLPQGVYDVEMIRDVLLTDEEAVLPAHTGPALIMVTDGALDAATDGDAPATLNAEDGLLTPDTPTLRNIDDQPAVYVALIIGNSVQADNAPARTPVARGTAAPAPAQAAQATSPPEEATSEEQATEPESEPAATAPPDETAVEPTASSGEDSDGDGLSDADEADIGTSPGDPDTDGDDLRDGEEVDWGTDPFVTDTDGDGKNDGDEVHEFGTDPTDPDSHP